MIPETGSYQELKRAVLDILPVRSVICYQVVRADGVPLRSYFSMQNAILGLRKYTLEGQQVTIQPMWR